MATVNYTQRNKKPQIYLRLNAGKNCDFTSKTNICVEAKFWNAKAQKIRKTNDLPNAKHLNEKLRKLKLFVIDKYNFDFSNGVIINKLWLGEAILLFFDRPTTEKKNDNHTLYLTDFAQWWMTNKADKNKNKSTNEQIMLTIEIIKNFQAKNKAQLKNLNTAWINSFSQYLTQTKQYSARTSKAILERFKFFCRRAEELNIEINNAYKQRFIIAKQDKNIKQPYLNEAEITTLFEYDFKDKTLNDIRDNFIIGLWTGLRVSDFLTCLKTENIKNGLIEIQTQKTKTLVAIPLHYQISEIVKRRKGQLPPKTSVQHFNRTIKTICQIVGINTEMTGAIIEKTEGNKRKTIGVYKKYQLVSSHICRRSFCTNLFGKVPNSVIMSVAGWTSEKQMLDYVKLTHIEKAKELKTYWDEKYLKSA